MTAALAVADLRVALGEREIVNGVTLSIEPGSLVALVGPNGAGKTTFLRAAAGLIPARGDILIGGRPIALLSRRARARAIAFLEQKGRAYWPLPVRDLVALGRLPHGASARSLSQTDRQAVARALAACRLDHLAHTPMTQLSGGEIARALLARALAVGAPLLLVDEPVAALDPALQLIAMEALRREAREGRAAVAVMHDIALALRFADAFVVFDRGRAVAHGPPRDLVANGALERAFGVRFALGEADGLPVVAPIGPREAEI